MTKWYKIYRELAELLSDFYETYKEDSGKELYSRCIEDSKFRIANNWLDKFDSVFEIRSIDPIHIFSCISQSKVLSELRVERINLFFKILSSKQNFKVNEVDFSGCPTPFSIKILSARKVEIQKEIWSTFNEVIIKGQEALNESVFNKISNWFGVDISAFTIFLFWIDSENFMPLDKNTNKFLLQTDIYSKKPRRFSEYKVLLKLKNSDSYRVIAQAAYNFVKYPNDKEFTSVLNDVFSFLKDEDDGDISVNKIDFKIIAIRPLSGTSQKYLKVLQAEEVYCFYNSYNFSNLELIEYDLEKDLNIYDIDDSENPLDINICAIVGKNGSGKSSIMELLYLAINNFTKKILGRSSYLTEVSDVCLELFFFKGTIYKVELLNGDIQLYKYEDIKTDKNLSKYSKCVLQPFDKNILNDFFYSIAINYSQYALNSKDLGYWIDELFHKNDAYQVPLVINPMRTEGNININTENNLVKSRLLANILEPEIELRVLTESNKSAKYLNCSLNYRKIDYLYAKVKFPAKGIQNKIIAQVFDYFKIQIENDNALTRFASKYIYKKLVTISRNYRHYRRFYSTRSKKFKSDLFAKYLKLLSDDKSHITYKLRQAINYLKFSHFKYYDINDPIEIESLSENIQKVIEENYSIERLSTIELIPPSFFNVEIILNDGSTFEQLSSGEKQKIHTVNSLIYHLLNINSVSEKTKLIKYTHINVLFDEVELYFHPEMQRTFIQYLLNYLKKVNLYDIIGINICFVTHSPFILSDIPNYNIMFLEVDETGKAKQLMKDYKTFGGNMHDILQDSFFLDKGYMGDFANKKINSAITFLQSKISPTKYAIKKTDDNWTKDSINNFIEVIGEPLLRNSLRELFLQAFVLGDDIEIDAQIERLQNYKKSKNGVNDSDTN